MAIYGTALLSACLIVGACAGQLLGQAMGLNKNIGGVGIAMLLLIVASDYLQRNGKMKPPTEQGILFWSAIYIPIVVAMAASQDVLKAMAGGWLAVEAGILCVVTCFLCVPLLSRFGQATIEAETGSKQ